MILWSVQELEYKYLKSVEDREGNEICVDLVGGFLSPSWQCRNLVAYAPASKLIDEDNAWETYKRELFYFWNGKREYETEELEAQGVAAKDLLIRVFESGEPLSLVTGSGFPTPYSDMFTSFLNWAYADYRSKRD